MENKLFFNKSANIAGKSFLNCTFLLLIVFQLVACARLRLEPGYSGPSPLPADVEDYYSKGGSYTSYELVSVKPRKNYITKRYAVTSKYGESIIDVFLGREKSDSLVLVFPVLGGKPVVEGYFADYLASSGFDTAIIHRNDEFKDPKKVDQLEKILKESVQRDRVALDFFEKELGKKSFGSFGISRGAINAAITAGVDKRLEFNALILGGSDLVGIFENSSEKRIKNYVNTVVKDKKITEAAFYQLLRDSIKTDPKNFSQYIDARKTLLFLAVLDTTVPFEYGLKLRQDIGNPETVFLLAGHFTSLLYTQMVKMIPPDPVNCMFPFGYIEGELLDFFGKSFNQNNTWWRNAPIKIVQAPFNLALEGLRYVIGLDEAYSSPIPQESSVVVELPKS
jgi:hypothetical protein